MQESRQANTGRELAQRRGRAAKVEGDEEPGELNKTLPRDGRLDGPDGGGSLGQASGRCARISKKNRPDGRSHFGLSDGGHVGSAAVRYILYANYFDNQGTVGLDGFQRQNPLIIDS